MKQVKTTVHLPVPATVQSTDFACGPACLLSLLLWEDPGCKVSEDDLVRACACGPVGTDLADLVRAAQAHGLRARLERTDVGGLAGLLGAGIPCILAMQAWGGPHFAVAVGAGDRGLVLMDPALGGRRGLVTWEGLARRWRAGQPARTGWCAVVPCSVRDVAKDAVIRCADVPERAPAAAAANPSLATWAVPVKATLVVSGSWSVTAPSPWRAARLAIEDLSATRLCDRAGWHVQRVVQDSVGLGRPAPVAARNDPDSPVTLVHAEETGTLSGPQDDELAAMRESVGVQRRYRVWWEEEVVAKATAFVRAQDEDRAGAAAYGLAARDSWWEARPEATVERVPGSFKVPVQPVGTGPVRRAD